MHTILNIDTLILQLIQSHLRSPFMDTAMSMITSLGNGGTIWLIVILILLCIPNYRRWGIVLVCALILTALIGNIFVKNIFDRVRPCNIMPLTSMLITPPSSFSFPSGHSASSFASATVLWKMNRRVGILAFIVAALIAFSRLYLFVHYPTDVLGGIALGVFIACMLVTLSKKNHFIS